MCIYQPLLYARDSARCARNIVESLLQEGESLVGETDILTSDCNVRKDYPPDTKEQGKEVF